jgi:hypothetical protein
LNPRKGCPFTRFRVLRTTVHWHPRTSLPARPSGPWPLVNGRGRGRMRHKLSHSLWSATRLPGLASAGIAITQREKRLPRWPPRSHLPNLAGVARRLLGPPRRPYPSVLGVLPPSAGRLTPLGAGHGTLAGGGAWRGSRTVLADCVYRGGKGPLSGLSGQGWHGCPLLSGRCSGRFSGQHRCGSSARRAGEEAVLEGVGARRRARARGHCANDVGNMAGQDSR